VRDEFNDDTKDTLAKRVGFRCSNPNCRQPTSGPQTDPQKIVNVGVAAHITSASPGGPRHDQGMTVDERRSIENGIWLCQNCAKLVDNDPALYPSDFLHHWKRLSEEAARLQIESPHARESEMQPGDQDLIRFFAQCFDRPAFQDPFMQEGSMEAFDKAIEDTITAINTGCLRARDGAILSQSKGKAFLLNAEWRQQMDVVVDLLRAIRSRYDDALKRGVIHGSGRSGWDDYHCIHDPELADWMDGTRSQVLKVFSEVCKEAGVPLIAFPRHRHRRW
jgi:hypothetical protein